MVLRLQVAEQPSLLTLQFRRGTSHCRYQSCKAPGDVIQKQSELWRWDDFTRLGGHAAMRTNIDEDSFQSWQQEKYLKQQHDQNGPCFRSLQQQYRHVDDSDLAQQHFESNDPRTVTQHWHYFNDTFARVLHLGSSPRDGLQQLCRCFHSKEEITRGRVLSNDDTKLLLLCKDGHLDMALDMLFCIDSAPSIQVYLSLLDLCSKQKAFFPAMKVYMHQGLYNTSFAELLAEYLVLIVYGPGVLEGTCFTLPYLSAFTWTAMIFALVESGHKKEALMLLQKMLEDGIEPNGYTFVNLIKAYSTTLDFEDGKKIHAAACMNGFTTHLIVGSGLVSMYGKCGDIMDAENVFMALHEYDVISCNAMLAAYVDQGQGDNALRLYRQMKAQGICANQGTLVSALQACRNVAESEEPNHFKKKSYKTISFEIGQALHAETRRSGYAFDAFVNNTLVRMYGEIGAVLEAEVVFSAMLHRDVIAWNAMISTFVENNQGWKAIWSHTLMLEEGVDPDMLAFVLGLQACEIIAEDEQAIVVDGQPLKIAALKIGQALHLDACRSDFTSDPLLDTSLLRMYGKCGAIEEAEDMFLCLSERDIVSWNAMISVYAEQDWGQKALCMFRQVVEESVGMTSQTYVFALQACADLAATEELRLIKGRLVKSMSLEIGRALHGTACKKGLANKFVCNTLISMYGNCGAIEEAEAVFAGLSESEVISWNVMLSVYLEQGRGMKSLQLYQLMQEKGVAPNHLTMVFALQACGILAEKEASCFVDGQPAKVAALEIGRALHRDADDKGFTAEPYVGNSLLSMYGKCGAAGERQSVFTMLPCCDIVSWNTMLSMHVEEGQDAQALCIYEQLQGQSVTLDDATFICILQACSMSGSLGMCEQIHFGIVCAGYEQYVSLGTTLIHAYGSCASVVDMQALFDCLFRADCVSWNTCIGGYLGEQSISSCESLFEEMKQTALVPDDVTFLSVISGCSHNGFVTHGLEYFQCMRIEYGLTPSLTHYSAMVDLLGRAGDFKRIWSLVRRMPLEADLSTGMSLLAACRTHGNLELANLAFNHTISLKPEEATAYVLMSNIYAEGRPLGEEALV